MLNWGNLALKPFTSYRRIPVYPVRISMREIPTGSMDRGEGIRAITQFSVEFGSATLYNQLAIK